MYLCIDKLDYFCLNKLVEVKEKVRSVLFVVVFTKPQKLGVGYQDMTTTIFRIHFLCSFEKWQTKRNQRRFALVFLLNNWIHLFKTRGLAEREEKWYKQGDRNWEYSNVWWVESLVRMIKDQKSSLKVRGRNSTKWAERKLLNVFEKFPNIKN